MGAANNDIDYFLLHPIPVPHNKVTLFYPSSIFSSATVEELERRQEYILNITLLHTHNSMSNVVMHIEETKGAVLTAGISGHGHMMLLKKCY